MAATPSNYQPLFIARVDLRHSSARSGSENGVETKEDSSYGARWPKPEGVVRVTIIAREHNESGNLLPIILVNARECNRARRSKRRRYDRHHSRCVREPSEPSAAGLEYNRIIYDSIVYRYSRGAIVCIRRLASTRRGRSRLAIGVLMRR